MKYIHSETIHNLNAAEEIVPVICDIFNPRSVADVGCGTGTFLKVFKKMHVDDVVGIDGEWVNMELLKKNLNETEFIKADLEKGFKLSKRYDVAMCLEVAEHISIEKSDQLVENLCNLSDIIIFSAAVPYQGGQNHINEQWIYFWEKKFNAKGYLITDGLRQVFWEKESVELWYKQNIYIIAKQGVFINTEKLKSKLNGTLQTYIHPQLFSIKAEGYHRFYNGELPAYVYFKLLVKSVLKKTGLLK